MNRMWFTCCSSMCLFIGLALAFLVLGTGKKETKTSVDLNDCLWLFFHGLFLLIIAIALTWSLLYVTGVQILALLWKYIWIILWGRSQGPLPCMVAKMTTDSGVQMQCSVTPTGTTSAKCRLWGTKDSSFLILFSRCSASSLVNRKFRFPFSLLPSPPDTLPLGCMERISLLNSSRYKLTT